MVMYLKVFATISALFGGLGLTVASAVTSASSHVVTKDMPVTLAITGTGITLAFVAAWKVRGTLDKLETALERGGARMDSIERRLRDLERK